MVSCGGSVGLVKGWAHHVGLNGFAPDVDENFGAGFVVAGGYIAHTNGLTQRWGHGSGGYHSNVVAIGIVDGVILPGNATVYQLKPNQPAAYACFLLRQERLGIVKVFGKLGYPAKAGLNG